MNLKQIKMKQRGLEIKNNNNNISFHHERVNLNVKIYFFQKTLKRRNKTN